MLNKEREKSTLQGDEVREYDAKPTNSMMM